MLESIKKVRCFNHLVENVCRPASHGRSANLFQIKKIMNAICQKCRKRNTCNTLCYPIENYVNQNSRPDHEKKYNDNIQILYHRKREKPFSSFLSNFYTDLDNLKIEELLSDQNRFPFSQFEPRLKQTKIFLMKLYGKTYQEISDYFDIEIDEVRKIYNACKERFLIALKLMDDRKKICNYAEAIVKRQEARTGSIPSMKKQFLLSKLFDLTPAEIGKMMGIKTQTVMTNLKDYSQKNQEL